MALSKAWKRIMITMNYCKKRFCLTWPISTILFFSELKKSELYIMSLFSVMMHYCINYNYYNIPYYNYIKVYLLGNLAGFFRIIQDFIMKHGKVEGEPKSHGVSGGELVISYIPSCLVCLETTLGRYLFFVARSDFSFIPTIIAFPNEQKQTSDYL